MVDDFDRQITEQRALINAARVQMPAAHDRFMVATAQFLSAWFPERARIEFERFADAVTKLQPGVAKSLKQEVLRLAADARAVADTTVGDADLWWHMRQDPRDARAAGRTQPYSELARGAGGIPIILDTRIRRAMGRLAQLFHTIGLEPAEDPNGRGGQRAWRVSHTTNPEPSGDIPWEFIGDVAWPPSMRRAISDYAALHGRVREAFARMDDVSSTRSRRDATDLWDRL